MEPDLWTAKFSSFWSELVSMNEKDTITLSQILCISKLSKVHHLKIFEGKTPCHETLLPPLHQYVTLKCVLKNYSEGQLDKF